MKNSNNMVDGNEEFLPMIEKYVSQILSEGNYENPIQILQFLGFDDDVITLNYDCETNLYYVIDFYKNNIGLTTLEEAFKKYQVIKRYYYRIKHSE